jgi:RNA polymerase sigma-70 factor (ECF subfamily)
MSVRNSDSVRGSDRAGDRLSRQDEQALIAQARGGCQASARRLIDAHKDRLFAFVWRVVRNHHDTEEMCQEAFLRAFASLDSFSTEYRFSTWLFTIAYRLSLNAKRRKPMLSGETDFSHVAGTETGCDEQVAETEAAERLKETIWSAADQLSTPQRAAVLLFYREDQSCQEISAVMDMPVATVKSHLHRARARMRTLLSETLAENESVRQWFESKGFESKGFDAKGFDDKGLGSRAG